jgi:hypothetical protein
MVNNCLRASFAVSFFAVFAVNFYREAGKDADKRQNNRAYKKAGCKHNRLKRS